MSEHEREQPGGEPQSELATDDTVSRAVAETLPGVDVRAAATLTAAPDASTRTPAIRLPSQGEQTASPRDALLIDEVGRTRAFLVVVLAFHVIMPLLMLRVDGDPQVARVLYASMGITFLPSLWLFARLRDPRAYDTRLVTAIMLGVTTTTYAGVFYWGIFSPAPCLIVMGIYYFCRAQSLRAAIVIFAACAGYQAVLSLLVIGGALEDRGIFQAGYLSAVDRGLAQAMVLVVFAFTFWMARSSRRTMLAAFDRLEVAVRQVAQREAQLLEARIDLDRALRAGGAGRFTDHTLGSYRVGPLIGRGAMGEVYEATHTDTGDPAAIKLLHPNALETPEHVARFLREARIAGTFSSRHVVRVLEASAPNDPLPFLVMERLYGCDLSKQLRDMQRLPLRQIVDLVRQVGSALDEARAQGIVHRDLKPQNLFLANDDRGGQLWKVLDFGVSKLNDQTGTLTQGGIVGTPAYMAPEQATGDAVDHRTDLYALAAIAYRCATGRPPFTGKDLVGILYNVVNTTPAPPSKVCNLAPAFDQVFARGMAKRVRDRFDSAAELADALEAAGRAGG